MYINPFLAGVIATILAEITLLLLWAFYYAVKGVRR